MTKEEAVNLILTDKEIDKNKISDGYHTFGELYDHRIVLFICLCASLVEDNYVHVWRSKKHSDGSEWDGWFIMGIGLDKGKQITYHLPMTHWDNTKFASTIDRAPEWDGHTSADVLERLKSLK